MKAPGTQKALNDLQEMWDFINREKIAHPKLMRDWSAALSVVEDALATPAPQAREPAEPVAWIDPADFEALESDGWCVVHKSRCDPGADHSADVPLYAAPSQAEPAQPQGAGDEH